MLLVGATIRKERRRLMQFVECLASIIRELLLVKSKTAFNSVLGAIDIDCIIESLCVS